MTEAMGMLPESDDYILQLCLVSAARITCIIGLVIHFFIVGVSAMDWSIGRHLTTADLLVTSIGTSRIVFQFASLSFLFREDLGDYFPIAYLISVDFIFRCSTCFNIWLSVLLSVFYSLKISNFQNVLFLYLERIISRRSLGLIITSLLLSIGFSSVEVLPDFIDFPENATREDDLYIDEIFQFTFFMCILGNVLPLLFYSVSSLTLLGSLCRHIIRMNRDRNGTSHLDAYVKTIKFIVVSFFCFALYVSASIFLMYFFDFFGFAGLFLVWNCLPMLHSIYIVYMTARLRSHLSKVMSTMTRCLCLGRSSVSSSGVQIQIIGQ